MKPLLRIGLILLFLGIISYVSFGLYISHDNISFIEKTTSLNLHSGVKNIQVVDNAETHIMGKFTILLPYADTLIEKDTLKLITSLKNQKNLQWRLNHEYEQLDSTNRPNIINEENFYLGGNHDKWHSWVILLNKNTGELWIRVFYPDWAGTPAQ